MKRNNRWVLFFLAPFFIFFALFNLYPFLYGVFLSFHEWNGISAMKFTGASNYVRIFTQDTAFWKSVLNSAIMMIEILVPVQVTAVAIACILNYGLIRRGRALIRNIYFIPYMVTPVAIGLIFANIFDQQYGFLNRALNAIGIECAVDWLRDPSLAKPVVAFTNFWRHFGYVSFIYLAGMQSVSKDLYEAARVDGANDFQSMTRVIIPSIMPIIKFQITLGIMGGLKLFEEPVMLFGGYTGGTANAAQTMSMRYIDASFNLLQYGYGAAMGYVMFIIIAIASFSYFFLLNRQAHEVR